MGSQHACLLVFVFLLASSAASINFEDGNVARSNGVFRRSVVRSKNAAATTRANKPNDAAAMHEMPRIDEYEERGGLAKLMALTSKASPSAADTLLLRFRKTPGQAFTIMGLGKKFDNKKLLRWLHYTSKYRAKHGDAVFTDSMVLSLLRTGRNDAELRVLIRSIRKVPDLNNIGKKMELALNAEWFSKELRPVHLKALLAKSRVTTPEVEQAIVEKYAASYFMHLTKTLKGDALENLQKQYPGDVVASLLREKLPVARR